MAEYIPQAAMVPVVSLTPAAWNPRSIKDPRFQNLCESLAADPDFLQLRPILATLDGTVFAGNMRLRAAQQLGWLEIPAILVNIPEQLAKERAMHDNAQWGDWEEDDLAKLLQELKDQGSDLDLLGFEDRDLRNLLDRIGNEGGLTDPDDVPPLPNEPVTKPGDIWILGDHRLLCDIGTEGQDPQDFSRRDQDGEAHQEAAEPEGRRRRLDPLLLLRLHEGVHHREHADAGDLSGRPSMRGDRRLRHCSRSDRAGITHHISHSLGTAGHTWPALLVVRQVASRASPC